jgi:predicted nucleic-acid-binding protein
MIGVDTNVIIRFLTADDERQYKKAFSIFSTQLVFIPDSVIQETEWVLRYAYEFSPEEICDALSKLFGLKNIRISNPVLIAQAIEWHKQGMDFSDAMHLSQCQSCETLFTFDKSFYARGKNLSHCSVVLP